MNIYEVKVEQYEDDILYIEAKYTACAETAEKAVEKVIRHARRDGFLRKPSIDLVSVDRIAENVL